MKKITHQVLSVVMVCAVVTTGCIVAINLNQTPAEEYSPVGESEAIVVSGTTAVGLALATTAGAGLVCIEAGFCFDDNGDIADDAETKQMWADMYSVAATSAEKQRVLDQSLDNYLNETETVARMHAVNALVRGHADGNITTQYAAEQAAEQEALDYYSVKMAQVLKSWEASVHTGYRIQDRVSNESGLHDYDIYNLSDPSGAYTDVDGFSMSLDSRDSVNVVLPNNTAISVDTFQGYSSSINPADPSKEVYNFSVSINQPPDTGQKPVQLLDVSEFTSQIKDIQAQATEVRSNVGIVANETWAGINSGALNETALVDPYLGAMEYSPGSGTWTRRMLTSIGVEAPHDLATYKRMTIITGGSSYTGTLMSDGQPTNGYQIGGTYDASNITGAQYIVTDDGQKLQLKGTFTLQSATFHNGTAVPDDHRITYPDVDQDVSSVEDFKKIIEALDEYRSEENAKEQRAEDGNTKSAGILPEGVPPWAAVVVAGLAVAMWVNSRDEGPTVIER